jgi:tetratricopeptide (TPR) repeat protein
MPRFLTALCLALAALVGAQELRVPVLGEAPRVPVSEGPLGRPLLTLAEEALSAGLASTSAELHHRALALPDLTPAERERATLGLALALLERNRPAEALLALASAPPSSRRALRESLAALLRNDREAAGRAAEAIRLEDLPSAEKPWAMLALAVSRLTPDAPGPPPGLAAAAEAAVSPAQRLRIELLGLRALLQHGAADRATLAELERRAREAQGTDEGAGFARLQAAALARAGKLGEAVALLDRSAEGSPARQSEADLIAGLLIGSREPEGLARLRSAAARPEAPNLTRAKAIAALATTVAESPPDRVVQVANGAYAFLSDGKGGCPRNPGLTDAIHLARARVMLAAGNRDLARAAAEDLLREIPGSPLAPEAMRLLALVAWGDGAYRLAATHLDQLAAAAAESERDAIRATAADCLFLAGDHALAKQAYVALQASARASDIRDAAFHQAVLCSLRLDKGIETAAARVEAAAKSGDITRRRILIAAWNTADAARRLGGADTFAQTLARLAQVTQEAPLEFDLRFTWLRALAALANGDRTTATLHADQVARTLANLPEDAPADLRSAAPELAAHAALLRARIGSEGPAGIDIRALADLRARFGKVSASAAAYLVEGRLLAAEGRHREAQARFEQLAADFAQDAGLVEFAALGLHEAAEQAVILADAGGGDSLRDAARLLTAFLQRHPSHPLAFRAHLRLAEVYRRLGDFDSGLRVLDDLGRLFPQHPRRAVAELARADCLMGLAALRRAPNGGPERIRINRAVAAYERAVASNPGQPDILAEARHKLAQALLDRSRGEGLADAEASRREARQVLAAEAADLLKGSRDNLGVAGRIWVARSLLLLGEHCQAAGDLEEARAAFRLLRDLNAGLPEGGARLPGKAAAESKLAELGDGPSNAPSR